MLIIFPNGGLSKCPDATSQSRAEAKRRIQPPC
nr:MAG TPA: hypothetical protein [Caudoviricetes sp.]